MKDRDYPGALPLWVSNETFSKERDAKLSNQGPTVEEPSVRGTLVTGLNAQDILLLDTFEGSVRF